MSSKHFVNDPTYLVDAALQSITLANPSTALDAGNKIVYRRPGYAPQVSLVSGGGSGHEPAFAGYVGDGLLTAAVAGTIFASPSAEQIRRCLLNRIDGSKGILVITMNYTGDTLNFGMACEQVKAKGLDVEFLVVGDEFKHRRGIAGVCLVIKIAGALAAQGASLREVYEVAKLAADNTISIGSSLEHVHVPGRAVNTSEDNAMRSDEVEIGMGIHNEPGSERRRMTSLPDLVKSMLEQTVSPDHASVDTVLLVNNLGGVSVLELGAITTEVVRQLEADYNVKPVRILSGAYMTSLNGLGFSISLLKVKDTGLGPDKGMLSLLDAPSEALGWLAAIRTNTWENRNEAIVDNDIVDTEDAQVTNLELDPASAKKALSIALERLIRAEPDLTRFDTAVGDGDCGIGLKRGAEAIKNLLNRDPPKDVGVFLHEIVKSVEANMDGTSGAIYAIFMNALARGIHDQAAPSPTPITAQVWARALSSSLDSLSKYTPARPGDRTLIDALHPFVKTFVGTGNLGQAAQAAEAGAKGTKGMKANLGRTVYVGGEAWQEVPDPGAYGLAQLLVGLSEGLK